MTLESFFNDYAASCLGDDGFYDNFDKLSVISKFQLIAKFILNVEIDKSKGTMDSLNLRPIEKAKIECAKKLFNDISTSNVKYHEVDSYQHLLEIVSK